MIEGMKAEFGITYLCHKLGVSESGYHAWASRPVSARAQARWEVAAKVLASFVDSGRSAGHRKITVILREDHGIVVDRKTVLSVMQDFGIMSPAARAAHRRATARARRVPDPTDLVDRNFTATTPGTVMVGDITYVATSEGWLYVATVIDLATRAVLGWASGKRQTAELVVTAMKRAIRTGHVQPGAIFHTDHGTQYRSKRFTRFCARNSIRRSMGRNFECWDNAVAESFFSKLKNERLRWITFPTRHAATRQVADYIRYFNTRRPHQTLGYATPFARLTKLTSQALPVAA